MVIVGIKIGLNWYCQLEHSLAKLINTLIGPNHLPSEYCSNSIAIFSYQETHHHQDQSSTLSSAIIEYWISSHTNHLVKNFWKTWIDSNCFTNLLLE